MEKETTKKRRYRPAVVAARRERAIQRGFLRDGPQVRQEQYVQITNTPHARHRLCPKRGGSPDGRVGHRAASSSVDFADSSDLAEVSTQTNISFPATAFVFSGITPDDSNLSKSLQDEFMGRRGDDLLPCFIHGYSRSFSPRCSYCETAAYFTARRIASKASQNCTADLQTIADDADETIEGFLASLTGNTIIPHW